MPTLSARTAQPGSVRTDAVVIGVVRTAKGIAAVDAAADVQKAFGRGFVPMLSSLGFTAEPGQVAKLPSGHVVKTPLVVAVGLGDAADVDRERVRRCAAAGVKAVSNAVSVALALPVDGPEDVRAVGEGALLGLYSYDRYRSADSNGRPTDVVVLTAKARNKDVKRAVETAETVVRAVCLARDWVNTPPNDLTPALFAEAISSYDGKGKVKVAVLDEQALAKQRCGGILGVGQGSENSPRLVSVTYAPRRPAARVALVGKGITFDSGGLSIKPAAGMETMKLDMGGAAAVLQSVAAIAQLSLPIKVTAYLALAENMPSGTAQRPSDVITTYGGRTVEVLNTDAEGRLVMADAIAAASEEHPDLIVDIATLTGAQMIALGNRTSAIMSNDDDLRAQVHAASERAGEQFWPMPLPEELRKSMDSPVADIANMGERYGGMLVAGLFLREFVGRVSGSDGARSGRHGSGVGSSGAGSAVDAAERRIPWAHLDIAGPSFNDGAEHGYTGKGGTGVGVRTLLALAEDLAG